MLRPRGLVGLRGGQVRHLHECGEQGLLPAVRGAPSERLVLANGPMADRWRSTPGVVDAATVDLRTPAEKAEQARLRAEIAKGLEAAGLDELVPALSSNLFQVAIDQRVPEALRFKANRMLDIGLPTSVLIAPPDALVL